MNKGFAIIVGLLLLSVLVLFSTTYTVRFNDAVSTSGNFALSPNLISAQLSGANTTSITCGGGNNANFQVSFSQNALLNVPAGTYTGTLTLVIEPA